MHGICGTPVKTCLSWPRLEASEYEDTLSLGRRWRAPPEGSASASAWGKQYVKDKRACNRLHVYFNAEMKYRELAKYSGLLSQRWEKYCGMSIVITVITIITIITIATLLLLSLLLLSLYYYYHYYYHYHYVAGAVLQKRRLRPVLGVA